MTDFSVIYRHLYKMGFGEILCTYVLEYERPRILTGAHGGITGGHYVGREIMQKILRAGLWWPMVHKDLKTNCRVCDLSNDGETITKR